MMRLTEAGPCKCGATNFALSSTPGLCPKCCRAAEAEWRKRERDIAKSMGFHQLPEDVDERTDYGMMGNLDKLMNQ